MVMDVFEVVLLVATLLVTLVAGFVFGFAVVAMPGIGTLDDREFLRSFQVMDRVIQNNQPLFILVWVGSVVAVVAAALLGFWQADGAERLLVILAAVAYVLGVQLPTVAINIPLNNRLQTLDVEAAGGADRRRARDEFEQRWNRWNSIRTAIACLASVLLLLAVLRL